MCEISSDNRLGPLCQRFCSFLQDCLFASVFKTASSPFWARYRLRRNCAALGPVDARQSRSDTIELLGLCEKAGRRAPAAPTIDLECLAPTRRQRRALVRRLRRRTSRSP